MVAPFKLPETTLIRYADIDDEHRKIVDVVNAEIEALHAGDACSSSVSNAIIRTSELMALHFLNEESEMNKLGFPGADAHARHHTSIISHLNAINDAVVEGTIDSTEAVARVLHQIIREVLQADLMFKEFLEGANLVPTA